MTKGRGVAQVCPPPSYAPLVDAYAIKTFRYSLLPSLRIGFLYAHTNKPFIYFPFLRLGVKKNPRGDFLHFLGGG